MAFFSIFQKNSTDPVRSSAEITPKKERSILLRLFKIGPFAILRLMIASTLVGLAIQSLGVEQDLGRAAEPMDYLTHVGQVAWTTAKWAVYNFWKPALAGAAIVLPLWVLWRLVTLPFR